MVKVQLAVITSITIGCDKNKHCTVLLKIVKAVIKILIKETEGIFLFFDLQDCWFLMENTVKLYRVYSFNFVVPELLLFVSFWSPNYRFVSFLSNDRCPHEQ